MSKRCERPSGTDLLAPSSARTIDRILAQPIFPIYHAMAMSSLHRIQWIDEQIRRERYPNCSDIAERFEITRRQASRDIEYLRYSLDAPVEYDATHRCVFGSKSDIP